MKLSTYRLALAPLLLIVAGGCVGRGKYLEALLAQEAARSEATAAETDLADATARYQTLQRALATLQAEYDEQRRAAYQQQSGDLTERQALLKERTLQGLVIDSLRRVAEGLGAQRVNALAVVERRDERLRQIRERLAARTGNFLPGQATLSTRSDAVVLEIDERALFDDRRTPGISAFGEASLGNIAGALGGQPDLLIDVIAAPRDRSGSPKAREEAARRATLVVSYLVEGRGLLPEIVRAVATQTDAGTASVAGLVEDGGLPTLRIEVSVPGDGLGQVGRALR